MSDQFLRDAKRMAQRGLRAQAAIDRREGRTWAESLICPRCGHGIPSDERRGEYPGALSRLDNETYICSRCGELEALYQFFHRGPWLPPIDQPVPMAPLSLDEP